MIYQENKSQGGWEAIVITKEVNDLYDLQTNSLTFTPALASQSFLRLHSKMYQVC